MFKEPKIRNTVHDVADLMELGKEFFAQGKFNQARDCFFQATKLDPANGCALNGYATSLCELNQGHWSDEALAALVQALQVDPANAKAWNNMGDYHYRRGEFDKAIEYFKNSIENNPAHSLAYVNLALAYRNTHRSSDALKALCGALILDPNCAWTRYQLGLTYLNRGLQTENFTDLEKAFEVLNTLDESELNSYLEQEDDAKGFQLEKMVRVIGTFILLHRNMHELKDFLVESLHYYGEERDDEVFSCMVN
jgi:tetratricopeptide (TPR) repeat protein